MVVEVIVGRVVKPHGVRGDVVVELHTDEPERRFAVGSSLTADELGRCLRVRATRRHSGRLVVNFEGVTTRDEAERLIGQTLTAQVQDDESPEDDAEFYDRQLVGLQAKLPDGRIVGQVTDVIHGPAQDALVINTDAGERLVPFVDALVPSIDVPGGYVTIADLPGLLDDTGV